MSHVVTIPAPKLLKMTLQRTSHSICASCLSSTFADYCCHTEKEVDGMVEAVSEMSWIPLVNQTLGVCDSHCNNLNCHTATIWSFLQLVSRTLLHGMTRADRLPSFSPFTCACVFVFVLSPGPFDLCCCIHCFHAIQHSLKLVEISSCKWMTGAQ